MPGGLRQYYYDAATGNMIWQHVEPGVADVARGTAGDIDPRFPGMEVWSFSDLYNALGNRLTEPNTDRQRPRLVSTWNYGAVNASQGVQPTFVGDILGDWREEAVYTNASFNELIIFTTNQPSSTRLYTLTHNPAYRNDMTVKGYMQSHHVDYFLGAGMTPPSRPNITYAG